MTRKVDKKVDKNLDKKVDKKLDIKVDKNLGNKVGQKGDIRLEKGRETMALTGLRRKKIRNAALRKKEMSLIREAKGNWRERIR